MPQGNNNYKRISLVHIHKCLAQHFRKAPQNLTPMGLGDENVLRFQFHNMYFPNKNFNPTSHLQLNIFIDAISLDDP